MLVAAKISDLMANILVANLGWAAAILADNFILLLGSRWGGLIYLVVLVDGDGGF